MSESYNGRPIASTGIYAVCRVLCGDEQDKIIPESACKRTDDALLLTHRQAITQAGQDGMNIMNAINLITTITTNPDFSGGLFYVQSGGEFDANDYAEHAGLNRHDIDADDIHAAQDKASGLNDGEWMLVDHE